jgi:integrase
LLAKYRSKHPELALTNENGEPLLVETFVNGHTKKKDNVRSAYNRLATKLKIDKPLKLLRKTAATKLGGNAKYSRFAQYFLGHAPTSVADRHYVAPSEKQFDDAVRWLGKQFA